MIAAGKWAVLCGTVGLMMVFSSVDAGADVTAYPAKGQGPEQQAIDKAACQQFAKAQTGFDPQQALEAAGTKGAPPPTALRARKRAKQEKQELAQENQQKAQMQQKLQAFNKAEGVCLKGRGYSVG